MHRRVASRSRPTGLDSNTSKVLVEPVGPYEQDQPYGRLPG